MFLGTRSPASRTSQHGEPRENSHAQFNRGETRKVRVVVQVLTSSFNKVSAAAYDTPTAESTSTLLRGVRRRMLPPRPLRTPAYGETDTNRHYAERDPLVSESFCKILEPPHLRGRGWTGLHEAHLAQVGGMPRGNGAQQVPLEVVHQDVVPKDARLEALSLIHI